MRTNTNDILSGNAVITAPKELDYRKLNREIFKILTTLGIRAANKGFDYLQRAVEMTVSDPSATDQITKVLYRDIAKEFGTNWRAVERAIRFAISNMGYSNLEGEIFPKSSETYTNKEFIMQLSRYVTYFIVYN